MLSAESKGLQLYNVFRKFERTKKLSDIIHRNNIKTFKSIKHVKPSVTVRKKKKINEAVTVHRVLDVAKVRGYSAKTFITSYLYDKDGLVKKPKIVPMP